MGVKQPPQKTTGSESAELPPAPTTGEIPNELEENVTNPYQQATQAFDTINSFEEMQALVARFPFMTIPGFVQALAEPLVEPAPKDKPLFVQRVKWLKQIASDPSRPGDPAQKAFDAFQVCATQEEMGRAVGLYPLLRKAKFLAYLESIANSSDTDPELKRIFEQRIRWLRAVVGKFED